MFQPDSTKLPVPPEVQKWQKLYTDYTQQWNMLSEAIKGSSIDPVNIDYSLTTEEALKSAIRGIESRGRLLHNALYMCIECLYILHV